MIQTDQEQAWSESEFQTVELGDKRLARRLKQLAGELASAPTAPINQACAGWTATKAAYRFFQNEKVSSKHILYPHQTRTLERMAGEKVVLAVQDTTYLNFSSHPQTCGLGPIGDSRSNSQGLVVHSTLVVTTQGLPLGVMGQRIWARDGYNHQTERERKNTSIEHKESYRPIQGIQHTQTLKPIDVRVVTLCDRESDIYEFYMAAEQAEAEFVIRAAWDRHVNHSEFSQLGAHVQAQPVSGCYWLTLPAREHHPARTAKLVVRFAAVTLRPTQRSRNSLFYPLTPVDLYAVYVTEIEPPDPDNAIEWMLLTNIAVHSFEQALEKLDWYQCRWQIEVFHKILKHGCTIKRCRLQSAERLQRYITLMSIVAWRLFWITHLQCTCPSAPASLILTQVELRTLVALDPHLLHRVPLDLSVAQAVVAIAKLGGFLARRGDREPGPTVLWRGWTVLQNAVRLAVLLL